LAALSDLDRHRCLTISVSLVAYLLRPNHYSGPMLRITDRMMSRIGVDGQTLKEWPDLNDPAGWAARFLRPTVASMGDRGSRIRRPALKLRVSDGLWSVPDRQWCGSASPTSTGRQPGLTGGAVPSPCAGDNFTPEPSGLPLPVALTGPPLTVRPTPARRVDAPGPLERAPNQKALIANIPKVDFDSVEVPLTEGASSRM
jgi:hypothetical protein